MLGRDAKPPVRMLAPPNTDPRSQAWNLRPGIAFPRRRWFQRLPDGRFDAAGEALVGNLGRVARRRKDLRLVSAAALEVDDQADVEGEHDGGENGHVGECALRAGGSCGGDLGLLVT